VIFYSIGFDVELRSFSASPHRFALGLLGSLRWTIRTALHRVHYKWISVFDLR
jgi:hypothetical protein